MAGREAAQGIALSLLSPLSTLVVPEKAGTQFFAFVSNGNSKSWIPAFAGMTTLRFHG